MSASTAIAPGTDLRDLFSAAYNNRYTWEPGFGGYSGRCVWIQGDRQVEGQFHVGSDLKAVVEGVSDEEVKKGFMKGCVSKEEYEAALRGHQAAVDETKSEHRAEACVQTKR